MLTLVGEMMFLNSSATDIVLVTLPSTAVETAILSIIIITGGGDSSVVRAPDS